jgi:hypothetical protein
LLRSFLVSTAGCSDLAGRHQLANIPLQEAVVIVELVVFLADSFDPVEDRD